MLNKIEEDPDPASQPVRLEDALGPAVLVQETTTLREVASLMLERQVDSVVVVDASGAVRGVVTDRDLTLNEHYLRLSTIMVPRLHGHWVTPSDGVEAACVAASTMTAADLMHSRPTTATVREPIGSVVERMLRRDAEYALVLQDGDVIGTLGRRDLLRLVAGPAESHPANVATNRSAAQPTAHLAAHANGSVLGRLSRLWR